ncbi:TSR1 protein, partial [Atractosteus spatula]|nr:TSR1 protein [Atractosteus spatula]
MRATLELLPKQQERGEDRGCARVCAEKSGFRLRRQHEPGTAARQALWKLRGKEQLPRQVWSAGSRETERSHLDRSEPVLQEGERRAGEREREGEGGESEGQTGEESKQLCDRLETRAPHSQQDTAISLARAGGRSSAPQSDLGAPGSDRFADSLAVAQESSSSDVFRLASLATLTGLFCCPHDVTSKVRIQGGRCSSSRCESVTLRFGVRYTAAPLGRWGQRGRRFAMLRDLAEHCQSAGADPGEGGAVGEMEQEVKVLMKADPARQESLEAEAALDPMDGEQTWPTESELQEAEERQRKVRKVPKGTSDYQASWILEEGEEGGSEDDDEESSDEDGDEGMEALEEEEEDEEAGSQLSVWREELIPGTAELMGAPLRARHCDGEGSAVEGSDSETETLELGQGGPEQRYDDRMDEQEESEALRRYREARADQMFPDEVDTPLDTPARTRFQRYRGLKSFRSSPWDPLENLPPDYARIFQFQDFERTRRRVLVQAAEDEEGAMVGWYVTLHVQDVPPSVMDSFRSGHPLVLVSLLPHEQKMSVLHMLVRRHPGNSEPVKSKEELVFQCGFRRFRASPIFSQHTSGDKHKLERFLRADAPTVLSVYAPITFPTAGVLVFRQRQNGMQDLIATGSLLKADPQRVVVKRIVLSGHPFKIVRRTAVVRYMFFNRDDVNWFRPVELRTKWGRRGHIKEALGTHGHMKCVFDKQLPSQDTVLMTLYKRVFPRWTYDPHVPQPLPWVKSEDTVGTEDIDMD